MNLLMLMLYYWSVRENLFIPLAPVRRRKDQEENGNYYIAREILDSEMEKVSLADQEINSVYFMINDRFLDNSLTQYIFKDCEL